MAEVTFVLDRETGRGMLEGSERLSGGLLLALVHALRRRGCPHILVYTGHGYEASSHVHGRSP